MSLNELLFRTLYFKNKSIIRIVLNDAVDSQVLPVFFITCMFPDIDLLVDAYKAVEVILIPI